MASEHASPHLADCACIHCQTLQPEDRKNPFETTIKVMPRDSKERVNEDSYETEPESGEDRTQKDERIRQAPYLPRVQVWARDGGPYTLRVGHQWFHCDDLLINGDEYRQQLRKGVVAQSRPNQASSQSGGQPARRKPLNRQQSYQRTRPESSTPASRPTGALVRHPSRDKVERAGGYGSQALPEPRRKHVVKKSGQRPPQEADRPLPAAKSDVNAPTAGSLVPYKPPSSDPPRAYQPPQQTRPARPGGRLSRGNSYQIPVRQHGRKAVRFAPLPG